MKLFLSRIGLFIGFQIVFFAVMGMIFFLYTKKDSYYGAIVEKSARLHATPAPRFILIGGSNLSLGLDSVVLEKIFDYPVVNMGLHAGVDSEAMWWEIEDAIAPGDTIILSLEYGHLVSDKTELALASPFWNVAQYSPELLLKLFQQYPGLTTDRSFAFFNRMVKHFVKFLKNDLNDKEKNEEDLLRRSAFDRHGDISIYRETSPLIDVPSLPFSMELNPKHLETSAELFNDFHRYCQERQAKIFLFFVPLPTHAVEKHRAALDQLHTYYREHLNFPVLNQPSDLILQPSDIYDSIYHLSSAGALKKTDLLVESLEQWVPVNSVD